MAHILYVESDPTAIKAFTGILNRTSHQVRQVPDARAAWDAIQEDAFYDLVIMELKLDASSGRELIYTIRRHSFYHPQSILVYTRIRDREVVRQVLMLDVQNYLIKPYDDDKLFTEINRAADKPWWADVYESQELICDRLELSPEELTARYKQIVKSLRYLPDRATELSNHHDEFLKKLGSLIRGCGFQDLEQWFPDLHDELDKEHYDRAQSSLDALPAAIKLLQERIKPGSQTVSPLSEPEEESAGSKKKRARSTDAVATWEDVYTKLSGLEGYPVVESVAASFQMAARDPDIEIETLVHTIVNDPCLAIQVLYYTNEASEFTKRYGGYVEHPKQAIQLLGLSRLRALANSLISIPDQDLQFRGFDWRKYWMFQVGCGMLCEQIVEILSLQITPARAYLAGLIHELGKILLCFFYPETYNNAVQYSQDTNIRLTETENHYFGCSHRNVGLEFAKRCHLDDEMQDVVFAHGKPETVCDESQELVAVVSLADYLCKLHEIGYSGSRLPKKVHKFAEHPSWEVLKPLTYEGFTITKFERVCQERIQHINRELRGMLATYQA